MSTPHLLAKPSFFIITAAFISAYGQLADTAYVFTVEKVADHPPVVFPRDTIPDTCYKQADTIKSYKVRFSSIMDSVFINDGTYTFTGARSSTSADKIQYDLTAGRFVVWYTTVPSRAEFTVYGSGVPIIFSERGTLDAAITGVNYHCHSVQKMNAGNTVINFSVSINGRTVKKSHRKLVAEKKVRKYKLCF